MLQKGKRERRREEVGGDWGRQKMRKEECRGEDYKGGGLEEKRRKMGDKDGNVDGR